MIATILTAGLLSLSAGQTDGPAKGAPNASAATNATAAVDAPKQVCRRIRTTGSNVAGKRVCLTAAQWDKVARDSQELGRSMMPSLTTPNQ